MEIIRGDPERRSGESPGVEVMVRRGGHKRSSGVEAEEVVLRGGQKKKKECR